MTTYRFSVAWEMPTVCHEKTGEKDEFGNDAYNEECYAAFNAFMSDIIDRVPGAYTDDERCWPDSPEIYIDADDESEAVDAMRLANGFGLEDLDE